MNRFFARASMLVALVATAACGGVTQFAGAQSFAINGTAAAPAAEPRVELRDNKIEFKEKIQFEVNKATIKPESYSLLHEIAEVIKKNPQVKKISIEGHASSDGNPNKNIKLSRARAKSVMKHLVAKEGIAGDELMSRGWGDEKPTADNGTPEGREANRRVEFLVVEQDVKTSKVEIDPAGAEKVLEEKTDDVKADMSEAPPKAVKAKKAKKEE